MHCNQEKNYLINVHFPMQDGWYTMCISMEEYYKHKGYRLTGLAPGNWTFRIRPVSLGGDGMFTREKYFFIPLPPGIFFYLYKLILSPYLSPYFAKLSI